LSHTVICEAVGSIIFTFALYFISMNILLINHYAGSPKMGMEYRPYYLAKLWQQMGHEVTIIAADYSHIRSVNPVIENDFVKELHEGVNFLWVKTTVYQGNGLYRVRSMFDFVIKIWRKSKYIAKTYQPQVVIASSTYPSDNYVAHRIAKMSGAKYIYEVHDLWPLSPMELGGMSKFHPFIMAMQNAENFAYKYAHQVVSMLPATQEHMVAHGLDLKKWHYIPNGFVEEEWQNPKPLTTELDAFFRELRLKYTKVVGYTGTFGLANALEALIEVAALVPQTAIVLVGKGPEKEALLEKVARLSLNNVFILDSVSKSLIPALLSHFDILYIGLQSQPLFRFGISPNKLIDYMRAGKPIIHAIDAGNDMVKTLNCGISIAPEQPQLLAQAIGNLSLKSEAELIEMGSRGREYVIQNHDYKVLAERFLEVMNLP
jgi:glycosyltransferase involved in cell wall biosynthesis